jgi:hypothetical protein
VINGLDCGFLQLVVVTSEELEYMKVRTHKVGTRASEAAWGYNKQPLYQLPNQAPVNALRTMVSWFHVEYIDYNLIS